MYLNCPRRRSVPLFCRTDSTPYSNFNVINGTSCFSLGLSANQYLSFYFRSCLIISSAQYVTTGSTLPLHAVSETKFRNRTFATQSASWFVQLQIFVIQSKRFCGCVYKWLAHRFSGMNAIFEASRKHAEERTFKSPNASSEEGLFALASIIKDFRLKEFLKSTFCWFRKKWNTKKLTSEFAIVLYFSRLPPCAGFTIKRNIPTTSYAACAHLLNWCVWLASDDAPSLTLCDASTAHESHKAR